MAVTRKALVLDEAKQRQAAIVCLVESVKKYDFNWSAWLKLTELLDGEEEVGEYPLIAPYRL